MSAFAFDVLVFIGRFQPFHFGHLDVIQRALQQAETLIVLIGSATQPRSMRNPWTYEERCRMIRDSLPAVDTARVLFAPVMDALYNDEVWIRNLQIGLKGLVVKPRVGLIGQCKDHSSYYPKIFPQWPSIAVESQTPLNATTIRQNFFRDNVVSEQLPAGTLRFLKEFQATPDAAEIRAEDAFVREYRKSWDKSPYPPIFVTVDALLVQSGHVLMVERRGRPGKGLWALPGGFVDQEETLLDACLRELSEETRLKIPTSVLKNSLRGHRVFDHPYRSSRGRTITQVFHFELERQTGLPLVEGGEDATKAFWLPLAELNPALVFEDHFFIIQALLGR